MSTQTGGGDLGVAAQPAATEPSSHQPGPKTPPTPSLEGQCPPNNEHPQTAGGGPEVAAQPAVAEPSSYQPGSETTPTSSLEDSCPPNNEYSQTSGRNPEVAAQSAATEPSSHQPGTETLPTSSLEDPCPPNNEHSQTAGRDPEAVTQPSEAFPPPPQPDLENQHPTDDFVPDEFVKVDRTPQATGESPRRVSIKDVESDDIVIAVMGPTGSGKSTFISSASGFDTKVIGHTLKSFTSEVHAFKFRDQDTGRNVVLVDTPGFDDTFKSDLAILTMISDWLNSSYDKHRLLSGILYLHRITDNRMAGTPLKNLRVFRELCGNKALERVCLTTTMWDEVEKDAGESRLDELRREYWKPILKHGARIVRCGGEYSHPKEIIRDIVSSEERQRVLQLQQEMGNENKELKETAAGQELFSQLEKLVERQSVLLQRIVKERKAAASNPDVLALLQEEYGDLRVQIDERLRQMQVLKLSWFKNLRRFLPGVNLNLQRKRTTVTTVGS